MIRRWSYINSLNNFKWTNGSMDYKYLSFSLHKTTFKDTTYYRRKIRYLSRLARRSWARRKHLGNWVFYQNILNDWSQDYLFFRKYNRFILNVQLFKNSFFVYNLLIITKIGIANFIGSEKVMISSLINRVSRYYSRINPSFWTIPNNFRCMSWLYVTTNLATEELKTQSPFATDPVFTYYQTAFFTQMPVIHSINWVNTILNYFFQIIFNKICEIYKITVSLILHQIL